MTGSGNGIDAVPGKFESRMPADLVGGGVTKGATELWFGCLLVLRQAVSLCSPGWPPTQGLPASASQVLGL